MKMKIVETKSGYMFATSESENGKAFEVELPENCEIGKTSREKTCILDENGRKLTHIEKYPDRVCIYKCSAHVWAEIVKEEN